MAGDLRLGDVADDLIGDSPQGQGAVARPRNNELIVEPRRVKYPVLVRALVLSNIHSVNANFLKELTKPYLSDDDRVQCGQLVDCNVVRVLGARGQE